MRFYTKEDKAALENQITALYEEVSKLDRLKINRGLMLQSIDIEGYWSVVAHIQEQKLDRDYDELQELLSIYEKHRSI